MKKVPLLFNGISGILQNYQTCTALTLLRLCRLSGLPEPCEFYTPVKDGSCYGTVVCPSTRLTLTEVGFDQISENVSTTLGKVKVQYFCF
jgi:hypothetical protein